jgi:hypothetical protein
MAFIYSLTDTWADAGVTFTAIKMNVTDTASSAGSLLMDLQVGGSSRFSVDKAGALTLPAGASNSAPSIKIGTNAGIFSRTSGSINIGGIGNFVFEVVSGEGIRLGPNQIGWGTTVGGSDLVLLRDAADTLAQRRSTNAQAFRVYNTFTDASNYERGKVEWASNVLRIGTEKAGTGTARALEFQTDGTTRLTIAANGDVTTNTIGASSGNNLVLRGASTGAAWRIVPGGNFEAQVDNTYDIGASAANRPRNLYMASWIRMATTTVASLPAAATAGAGARMFVTDALVPVFGSAVAGGGAVTVPVYSTGSAWNVG